MSLLKMPDEILLQIGSHLLPEPPQLADKPVHTWTVTIRNHSLTYVAQARAYYALGQACKRLYDVLPRPNTHAHIPGLNIQLICSVLKNIQIQSLSSDDLFDGWERQEGKSFHLDPPALELQESWLESSYGENAWINPSVENRSIHTLYLLDFEIDGLPYKWLIDKLKGLKTLYLDCKFDASLDDIDPKYISTSSILYVLMSYATSLEKLVLTRQATGSEGFDHELDHLVSVRNLTSLSLSSFLLVGDSSFNDGRKLYRVLPSGLRELEVIWEDSATYPFMSHPAAESARPEWLFELLQEKHNNTPQLERVRVISIEEWHLGIEETEAWDGAYSPSPHDWTAVEGNKSWRPPTELIVAAETAQVSLGIWLHPQRRFKLVLPGCEWFADSWEDTWIGPADITTVKNDEEEVGEDDTGSVENRSSQEESFVGNDQEEK